MECIAAIYLPPPLFSIISQIANICNKYNQIVLSSLSIFVHNYNNSLLFTLFRRLAYCSSPLSLKINASFRILVFCTQEEASTLK